MFEGGPVEPDALIALAYTREPMSEATDELSPVNGRVASADLSADPAFVAAGRSGAGVPRLRRVGAWQLEGEIEAGAWLVLDADPDDVFGAGAGGAVAPGAAPPGWAARVARHEPPTISAPTERNPRTVCFRLPVGSSDADRSGGQRE